MINNSLSVFALVTARGGSKGIPNKNLKKINGISLIAHAANVINSIDIFDYKMISSDNKQMLEEGLEHGLEVPFIRPSKLAADDSTSLDVWKFCWEQLETKHDRVYDISVLIEPTSPMRTRADILDAINLMITTQANSCATVSLTPTHFSPEKTFTLDEMRLKSFSNNPQTIRQNIPNYYHRNGLCYVATRKQIFENNQIIDSSTVGSLTTRNVVNIDDYNDLELARYYMSSNYIHSKFSSDDS